MAVATKANPKSNGSVRKSEKPKIIRRLGAMESFQASLHSMSFYAATVITCRYTPPSGLTRSPDYGVAQAVELAIAKTVLDNPLLQVGIYGESTKNPRYVALKQLDLSHHIEWRKPLSEDYDDVYNATLQVQMDQRFSNLESQPGWRIAVLENQTENFLDIMFSWHHSVSDGMGAKIFQEQLLRNLSALDSLDKAWDSIPLKDHLLVLPKTWDKESFPPRQEDLGRYKVSLDYFAKTLWHEIIPPSTNDPYRASWAPVLATPFATNFRRICIDNGTLQRLLVATRQNKTTLTGLFHGITLASLSSQLTEKEARGFTSSTARNMRPSTPVSTKWDPSNMICDIVSIVDHQFSPDIVTQIRKSDEAGVEELIWSVSATVRATIRKAVDIGLKNTNIPIMGLVNDWNDYQRSLVKKPRGHAWVVTNLGVLDGSPASNGEESKSWKIERSQFSLSAEVTGSAIRISTIAVKGRELIVEIGWQEGIITRAMGEQFVANMEKWLVHLGREHT